VAHITEIRIEGLAGSDRVFTASLNRDVNVIFGLNGSGKTSLLRILDSAMNDDPTSLYRVPFRRASVTIYTKNFNRLFTRSIERPEPVVPIKPPEQTPEQTAETENAALLFRNMQWKTEPTQRTLRGRFRHIFLPTSRLYLGAAPSSYRAPSLDPQTGEWVIPPPQEDDLEQQFEGQLRAIWSAYSATILTKVKEAQEAGLADILRNILSAQARRRKKRSPGRTISLSTAYQRVSNFLARQGSAAILGTPEAFWKRYSGNSQIRNIVNQIDRVEEQIEAATVPREKLKPWLRDCLVARKPFSSWIRRSAC
jgi:energy-coupling factor transporter ATP-binding protein EcfA2